MTSFRLQVNALQKCPQTSSTGETHAVYHASIDRSDALLKESLGLPLRLTYATETHEVGKKTAV